METNDLLKTAAIGALTGLAGAFVIRAAQTARQKTQSHKLPQVYDNPAHAIVRGIETFLPDEMRDKIPKSLESFAASMIPLGYGSTGAALYSSVQGDPSLLIDGAALGLSIWGAEYLGVLPALGVTQKGQERNAAHMAMALLQHVMFGVATISAFRKLRGKTGQQPAELPVAA